MAAYRRVYDSRQLQADCQKPGICSGTLCSVIEYGLPLPFTAQHMLCTTYIIQMIHSSECDIKYDEPEVQNVARGCRPSATFSTEGHHI